MTIHSIVSVFGYSIAVAQDFGIARETVRKMLGYSVSPGYRRKRPVKRPKLRPWIGVIDAILEEDKNSPVKQPPRTAKRRVT